ncbi:hypothetical protein I316_00141 [Kwoniella heveanensis BCC8398]|uniref:Uncharacterized protein n=1 Tax=Kwoniella heveanensis BCC8398 TaxID=1296120 RepID=A0A1B9H3S9_9TREE|nr:hypothetical protein I316_00141 [Kwoniella heveanensis BCC8398]
MDLYAGPSSNRVGTAPRTQTPARTSHVQIDLGYPFGSHEEYEAACKSFIERYEDEDQGRAGGSGSGSGSGIESGSGVRLEGRTNGGWEWREHKNAPHRGYMYRRVIRWLAIGDDGSSEKDQESNTSAFAGGTATAQIGSGSRSGSHGVTTNAAEIVEVAHIEEEEEMMEEEEDEATALLIPPNPGSSTSSDSARIGAATASGSVPPKHNRRPKRVDVEQYVAHSKTYGTAMFCFRAWDETGSPLPISQLLQLSFLRHSPTSPPSSSTDTVLLSPDSPFPLIQSTEHPSTGDLVFSIHPCRISGAVAEILEVELDGMWDRFRAHDHDGGQGRLKPKSEEEEEEREGDKANWERVVWLQVFMMLTNKVVDLTYP